MWVLGGVESAGYLLSKTHGARVRDSAATTAITHNSLTSLSFDTEVRDDGGLFSPGSSDRITIVQTGWYSVSGGASWAANSTGVRHIGLAINSSIYAYRREPAPTSGVLSQNIATVVYLSATDIVQLQVLQNSGGDLDLTGGVNYSPYLSVAKIG